MATHIFREGNFCAYDLANIGSSISSFIWWNEALDHIRGGLLKNVGYAQIHICFEKMWGIPSFSLLVCFLFRLMKFGQCTLHNSCLKKCACVFINALAINDVIHQFSSFILYHICRALLILRGACNIDYDYSLLVTHIVQTTTL
jgi:hypothetical protein